ncbi:hypothetical protein V8G54_008259 [Vigna mungo]|uniref:Uncharacterized protein n=1 Tax=Vigna mungo TaxID=3915 RepID=A0AAQ3P598_VIGMU
MKIPVKIFGDTPSSDLLPSQRGDETHTPTQKKGRSRTRLTPLTTSRSADHRLPIHFDMKSYKPLGESNMKFISCVALLSISMASITFNYWDHVLENVINQIWHNIIV